MGYHLGEFVYGYAARTSGGEHRIGGPAMAVLAYIAHRADDCGERECHPSQKTIAAATHYGESAVGAALEKLRDQKILLWTRGGRQKGGGGRSYANSYRIVLSGISAVHEKAKVKRGVASGERTASVSRETGHADPATEGTHTPSRGDHQKYSNITTQPSVTESSERGRHNTIGAAGKEWLANITSDTCPAPHCTNEMERLTEKAMRACGTQDPRSRACFTSTIKCRDIGRCEDEIDAFASEITQGEHAKARCPAAILNKRMAELPKASEQRNAGGR